MARPRFLSKISDFVDAFGSAVSVSAALRDGHRANPNDLRRLGIDPERFEHLKR
jgi:hypothetical protein